MKEEPYYFVWIKGVGNKPSPQKWYGDQTTGTDKFQHGEVGNGSLLAFHVLNEEERKMSLSELIAKFPIER